MKATSLSFTKKVVCITAAASFFLAAPTAAWSWPWNGLLLPSEEVGTMTSSDFSSTTVGLRLAYRPPSYIKLGEKPTSIPVGMPKTEPKRKAAERPAMPQKPVPAEKPLRKSISNAIISGVVRAKNGPPLADVILKLHAGNSTGAMVRTTTTSANGKYEFTGLPAGTYVVEETNTPDDMISVTLTDGEVHSGNDFVDVRTPLPRPTSRPIVTKPPTVCDLITIDFETAANGARINRGDYVSNQWKSLGLQIAASGTKSSEKGARIFDTTNPGTEEAGDPDLGAPNERCNPAGRGHGEGGEPGQPGVNCKPQGNALIVQEDNDKPDIPDYNVKGGTITFNFFEPGGKTISEIGLLDIEYFTRVEVSLDNGKWGFTNKVMQVPILGDNSFQVVRIDTERVIQIKVIMSRSGAVTFISFCNVPTASQIATALPAFVPTQRENLPWPTASHTMQIATAPPAFVPTQWENLPWPTASHTTPAPTSGATYHPSPSSRTTAPTHRPTSHLTPSSTTTAPIPEPTIQPTPSPTTPSATPVPTAQPTPGPKTPEPTPALTVQPIPGSTLAPTPEPTAQSTPVATTPAPTPGPIVHSTPSPTTPAPTRRPTAQPTPSPTTPALTPAPTVLPTPGPTPAPTPQPTAQPTPVATTPTPTPNPTLQPTLSPTMPATTPGPAGSPLLTTFYAVADAPYNETEAAELAVQIQSLPSDAEFLMHLGDIRSAASGAACQLSEYTEVAMILRQSAVPVFIIKGGKNAYDSKCISFFRPI